jgi:DNA adenine methylase
MMSADLNRAPFPYTGGKTQHAGWILDHIPEHDAYVEPFGGGAAVLLAKPRSRVEVYNDADSAVATFFRVLRDRTADLVEWLQRTPYSREVHERLNEKLYGDGDVDDDVEAAGAFFYLRYSSFAGGRDKAFKRTQLGPNGRWRRFAHNYDTARDRLDALASRFDGVVVENADYQEVIQEYDTPDTVFYCDPPYVGTEGYYAGDFDHARFVDTLHDLEADWVVSYADIPLGLSEYPVVEKNAHHSGGNANGQNKTVERLVMNFDADGEPIMSGVGQQSLTEY